MAIPPCIPCNKKMVMIGSEPNHADKFNDNTWKCPKCGAVTELQGKYNRNPTVQKG